ncbi:L,D-transpeptidase [Aureimonas populi]|uniref:L,D-transpeptidase n=1 Tax=Aureimonas populi TaxID=1701758 RepID=A0ABW5CIY8_9HYPH|nr:L,D-transpeptidase [Aureimonas populi]
MSIRTKAGLALAALLALCAAAGAGDAADRVYLDRTLAAERVLQLSPASGVGVAYTRPRLVEPYHPGQVVFEGNLPVAVVPKGGGPLQPLGSFADPRMARPAPPPVLVHPAPPPPPQAVAVRRVQPQGGLDPAFLPQIVRYEARHAPGTIVIDTGAKFLYLVEPGGKARRYGVGVGREGFSWKGRERVSRKAEWPGWTPPQSMIARERAKGVILPAHMPGGPENPLGARALYLGSTLYRIHGTNQPWTIGRAVSSGCIRMRNEDVIDLYERVPVGAAVIVI